MDRLQQAIKKAREQRGGVDSPASGVLATAAAPEQGARMRPAPAASPGDVVEAWRDLSPLTINPKAVIGNRLLAYSGGSQAIPYDMLRTKMVQQARKNGWKRIALVSPSSGCGKTTTAANLGLSLSRMRDMRSIVLDFDLRRMGLARALGQIRDQVGMGAVLERRVAFRDVALCHDGNVAFGLNSEAVRDPSEILQSQTAADVLAEIEEIYKPDIMIFDTPPLMASDDAHGFLQQVDCALLLAAAEKTPMDQIDVAERQLAGLTNVMGIVLNRCRYTSGAHGYEGEYY